MTDNCKGICCHGCKDREGCDRVCHEKSADECQHSNEGVCNDDYTVKDLPLWRITFDGLGDETIVLEAATADEAEDAAKELHPDAKNIVATQTMKHFPEGN